MTSGWGSVLQEKYATARSVVCCPTVDLIAILTTDRQLLVHRTISWQRILHIKPAEVPFTMETLSWSPDGMRLAVGCDEGELVVFSMATAGDDKGVEIKPHTGEDELRHESPIVAMHWVLVRDVDERLNGKPVGAPSAGLRDRTAAFVARSTHTAASQSSGASVLVTADATGRIGFWWNGLVLVAVIALRDRLGTSGSETVTIHSIMLATDLSALLVDISCGIEQEQANLVHRRSVLRVDLRRSLQAVQCDLGVLSRVGYEVRSIFEQVRTSLRQVASEWKNATRVFELKMSLIGSLYEKYGCEEPPQVDMLAIIAGGIASPALAQYFAQDIQEMSVIRMQKMFFGGCDTIQNLAGASIKLGLQQILFEVAELRGTVRWNHRAFCETLGVSTSDLDAVIENVGDMIATLEHFEKMVHETRQDFSLLFAWLLERIRIHTNDANSRPAPATSNDNAHKSLLNVRRLITFLQRAAQSAKEHQVKKSNKWLVETSFGNEVSKLIASSKLSNDMIAVERQWSDTIAEMIRALSRSIQPGDITSLNLGENVDEVHLHTRWMDLPNLDASNRLKDDESMDDDDDDEMVEALEAVDWDSLDSIREGKLNESRERTPVSMVVVRRAHCVTFFTSSEGRNDLGSNPGVLRLNFLCGGSDQCDGIHRMCLYGGTNSVNQELLVVIGRHEKDRGSTCIYLARYDSQVHRFFQGEAGDSTPQLDARGDQVKVRTFRTVSPSPGSAPHTVVTAQASRGIICVASGGVRLLILDAEDDSDGEEKPDGELNSDDSDDHDEGDL